MPDAVFKISLAGESVEVERWGSGRYGVILFSHSGDLASELRALNAAKTSETATYFQKAFGKDSSVFLWKYPRSVSARVDDALRAYFNGRALPRLDFRGLASEVVKQIRKKTGLRKICLVGNSLGAGIILWDYNQLRRDTNLGTVLVAPTPIFLPPRPPAAHSFRRATIVLDADNDVFVKDSREKKYMETLSNGPWPREYEPGAAWAHFIIGAEASLEYVGSLVRRTRGQDQKITFRRIPPKRVGDKRFAPDVRASSKLKVRLTSSNPRVARIVSGSRIQPLRPGTTTIRATQTGDRRWIGAFPVERTLEVKPKRR